MKQTILFLLLTFFSISKSFTQQTMTQQDSVLYSLALMMANELKSSGVKTYNKEVLIHAFDDVYVTGNPVFTLEEASNIFSQFRVEGLKSNGVAFLEENAKKPGVVTLPSGLQYLVIKEGSGEKPSATSTVTVHYEGSLIDGTIFDSSVQRGEPISFSVNGVIKGWQEAMQLMQKGSKWKLFIPYDLAYGDRGAGGKIPPYAALVFEVELLDFK